MFGCRPAGLTLILVVALAGTARPQAVVRGRIRADSSRASIPFAIVEVRDLARSIQASITGLYQLSDLPAGSHTLVARAIGYQPLTVPLDLAVGDTLDVDLLLLKSVTELATLDVTAKADRPVIGKMAGFAERRKAGFGRFYDLAAIQKEGDGAVLANVLRQTAGVIMIPLPYPCSGLAAASGRGVGSIELPAGMTCLGKPLRLACYFTIVIDGVRIWTWGDPDPPNVETIGLSDIEGLEIYRGPSEMPPQFLTAGSACGVIQLWTRTGGTP